MLPLTKTLLGLVWVFLVQGDTESNITSSGDVGGLPQSCSSVRTSHSLAAQGLFRAAQLLLCCQSSLYLVHKERMEKGSRKHPRASSTDTGQGWSGQTSWASLPWPSPPALLWSWVESGAASAGPGWHWHCISSGPAPSPPLPSAKAPAVLACSSKLKAKPAVESTALAQGANPCVQRPHSPHSCLQANGAVLGYRGLLTAPTPPGRQELCGTKLWEAAPASQHLCRAVAVPRCSQVTLQTPKSVLWRLYQATDPCDCWPQ